MTNKAVTSLKRKKQKRKKTAVNLWEKFCRTKINRYMLI